MNKLEKNKILKECLKDRESEATLTIISDMYIGLIKKKACFDDDRISNMLLGLYKAWFKFDPTKSEDIDKYLTISLNWIAMEYRDFLIKLPQVVAKKRAKFERLKHLPREEVISRLNIKPRDYDTLLKHSKAISENNDEYIDVDTAFSKMLPQDVLLDFKDVFEHLTPTEQGVILKKITGKRLKNNEKVILERIKNKYLNIYKR